MALNKRQAQVLLHLVSTSEELNPKEKERLTEELTAISEERKPELRPRPGRRAGERPDPEDTNALARRKLLYALSLFPEPPVE